MSNTIALQEFGSLIRKLRQEKKITLHRFAQKVGISPTYLSKIERGDFKPPGEEKIRNIARALDKNEDLILAVAGRIASDLPPIIQEHPKIMANFLRQVRGATQNELEEISELAKTVLDKKTD